MVNLLRGSSDLLPKRLYARWSREVMQFGGPLAQVSGRVCNGLYNRRGLLSCDSKAFEHFTMECCVEQLFRLPTTRILAWNICWLALLPEPIGITSRY